MQQQHKGVDSRASSSSTIDSYPSAAMDLDEALWEPFMADQEGLGLPFDEALLQELAALDAAEAGAGAFDGPQADGHVEDEDVYKMKELIRCAEQAACDEQQCLVLLQQSIPRPDAHTPGSTPLTVAAVAHCCREKPKDVIQYLEEEGVVKLGEFLVTVSTSHSCRCHSRQRAWRQQEGVAQHTHNPTQWHAVQYQHHPAVPIASQCNSSCGRQASILPACCCAGCGCLQGL